MQDVCGHGEFLATRSDIDALLIATGDRWHALATIMAMRAGKDVYSEKPSCMTIAEGRAVVQTARRYGRIYQTGTQRLSEANFVAAIELARTGRLGKVHTVRAHIAPWDAADMNHSWLPGEPQPPKEVLKLHFFEVCGLKRRGASSFCRFGQNGGEEADHSPTAEEGASVLIMQDALPLFKSFLKPVSLKQRARQLLLRCVIAFLMHLGKMSASRVAGAVRTDARHRAQVSRFLGGRYWRRCDLLGQLRAELLEMEARQGMFVFDIKVL